MQESDYPALYRDADTTSITSQRQFFRALALSLIALIVAAILSLLHNDPPLITIFKPALIAGFQVVLILLSLMATIYMAWAKPQKVWYGTRALAESVRTVSWRYMMRAVPYEAGTSTQAQRLFTETLKQILDDNDVSQHAIARSDGDQVTKAMNDRRSANIEERKTTYRTERIEDQLSWYRKKAKLNKRNAAWWFIGSMMIHSCAIAVSIAVIIWPEWKYSPTDILLTCAGAAMAWLQTKRFQELASSFSLTAHEISILKERLNTISREDEFSEFVGDAENAFSREHTQWRARLDAV